MTPLEIAAISLHDDQNRLLTISRNVANMTTPAFKRTTPSQATFSNLLLNSYATGAGPGIASSEATRGSLIDFHQGTLRPTGTPLDLAIDGPAFIELASSEGTLVTRGGSFHLDAAGRLVTSDGTPVLGQHGEITVPPGRSTISVDNQGTVRADGEEVDTIRLASFESTDGLTPLGTSTYLVNDSLQRRPSTAASIKSGFLEASNVSSVQEMVDLMQTTRHTEAMHRAIQAYDETLEISLKKFGGE